MRTLLFMALPFLVYFALQQWQPRVVALLLLTTLLLRSPARTAELLRRVGHRAWWIGIGLVVVIGLLWLDNDPAWVLLYPVFMSGIMLTLFASSLIRPPSIVERIARLRIPDMPPEGVIYTRHITMVWCGFFVLNGGIAIWTALVASREIWVFYNGFLSYVLMGLLFAGEWIYRRSRFGTETS